MRKHSWRWVDSMTRRHSWTRTNNRRSRSTGLYRSPARSAVARFCAQPSETIRPLRQHSRRRSPTTIALACRSSARARCSRTGRCCGAAAARAGAAASHRSVSHLRPARLCRLGRTRSSRTVAARRQKRAVRQPHTDRTPHCRARYPWTIQCGGCERTVHQREDRRVESLEDLQETQRSLAR